MLDNLVFDNKRTKSILNVQTFLLFLNKNVPCLYVLCTNRGHLVTNYIFRIYSLMLKQPELFSFSGRQGRI